MTFEQTIEKLKREYTDKLVAVDENRPELARFRGQTGQVKTVNMSGRALVQFDANNNIGWYDIALDFLRVIDKPLEKGAAIKEKPAKAPAPAKGAAPAAAGAKKGSAIEMARAQGAAGKGAAPVAGGAKKSSTADILAAARAAKASAAPAEAKAPEKKPAPAAGKPAAAAGGKMSTADILAAARAKKAAAEAAEAPAPTEAAEAAEAPVPEAAPSEPVAKKSAPSTGSLPTTTSEKVAWCRTADAK
jgi:hypothetical protein